MIVWRSTHLALLAVEQAKREAAEQQASEARAELERVRGELAEVKGREDRLMHQYVALATPKPAPIIPVREPDPVSEAIRNRAQGDAALRSHLSFWARKQREGGAEVEQIVKGIEDWTQHDQPDIFPW